MPDGPSSSPTMTLSFSQSLAPRTLPTACHDDLITPTASNYPPAQLSPSQPYDLSPLRTLLPLYPRYSAIPLMMMYLHFENNSLMPSLMTPLLLPVAKTPSHPGPGARMDYYSM